MNISSAVCSREISHAPCNSWKQAALIRDNLGYLVYPMHEYMVQNILRQNFAVCHMTCEANGHS